MPWTIRPARQSSAARLRRWRYDHSQHVRSFAIGAAVVAPTFLVLVAVVLMT